MHGAGISEYRCSVKRPTESQDILVAGRIKVGGEGPDGAITGDDAVGRCEVVNDLHQRQRLCIGLAPVVG